MAALIALLGGYLAYRAAMIKNEREHQAAERKIRRRKLALFLVASEVFVRLETEAQEIDRKFSFPPEPGQTARFEKRDFKIHAPDELTEIWSNLDIFPIIAIREIFSVRRSLPILLSAIDTLDDGKVYEIDAENYSAVPWGIIQSNAQTVWESSAVIFAALAGPIEEMAPVAEHSIRMAAIFGTPDTEE